MKEKFVIYLILFILSIIMLELKGGSGYILQPAVLTGDKMSGES